MNDLLSSSFCGVQASLNHHVVKMNLVAMGGDAGSVNFNKFFKDVESIKNEFRVLERLKQSLQNSHEKSKTLHNANTIKELRSRMENNVGLALQKAKAIKLKMEALERSNTTNRSLPECGPESSSDRTRISMVNGLKKKKSGKFLITEVCL